MRFDVITLFPELFSAFLTTGINRRAFEGKTVDVQLWNPRDFAQGAYRRIDDRPFGGGAGMVMMAPPLQACLHAIQRQRNATTVPVVLFSPLGKTLQHNDVASWGNAHASQGAILVCGRYEGIDQRFVDRHVTHQISLGDFILSGGEIAAMALLDAVARLQPGVLNDANSHHFDSFNPALDGMLDCPHYTRPEVWEGKSVPAVLLSGHHLNIEAWRKAERFRLTKRHRPDLLPVSLPL